MKKKDDDTMEARMYSVVDDYQQLRWTGIGARWPLALQLVCFFCHPILEDSYADSHCTLPLR